MTLDPINLRVWGLIRIRSLRKSTETEKSNIKATEHLARFTENGRFGCSLDAQSIVSSQEQNRWVGSHAAYALSTCRVNNSAVPQQIQDGGFVSSGLACRVVGHDVNTVNWRREEALSVAVTSSNVRNDVVENNISSCVERLAGTAGGGKRYYWCRVLGRIRISIGKPLRLGRRPWVAGLILTGPKVVLRTRPLIEPSITITSTEFPIPSVYGISVLLIPETMIWLIAIWKIGNTKQCYHLREIRLYSFISAELNTSCFESPDKPVVRRWCSSHQNKAAHCRISPDGVQNNDQINKSTYDMDNVCEWGSEGSELNQNIWSDSWYGLLAFTWPKPN